MEKAPDFQFFHDLFGIPVILLVFLTGFFASAIVELSALLRDMAAGNWELPKRYRSVAFIVARVLFAFVAGALVVILGAPTPLIALYMGASAPVLIDRLMSGLKPANGQSDKIGLSPPRDPS